MDISGATVGVIVAVLVAITLYLIWRWWRNAPDPKVERKKEEFWKSIH